MWRKFPSSRAALIEQGFVQARPALLVRDDRGLVCYAEMVWARAYGKYFVRVGYGVELRIYKEQEVKVEGTRYFDANRSADVRLSKALLGEVVPKYERLPSVEEVMKKYVKTGQLPGLYGASRKSRLQVVRVLAEEAACKDALRRATAELEA